MKYLKNLIKQIIFYGVFIMPVIVAAQIPDSVGKIKYTVDFKFADGIYLSFDQVQANKPLPKSRIISSLSYDDDDFYKRLLQEDKLLFYDDNGVQQSFSSAKIWGYSKNGTPYINVDGDFNRITYVGSICHFVAVVTEYNNMRHDPYMYNSYNYYNYGMSPSGTYNSKEMRQFLLDFKTGNIFEYDTKTIEALLMQDTELYDEYIALKKKDKKKLKFFYIRKYNERNPLYIPK